MSESKSTTVVGRVIGLWRYPVKSMGAESLTEVEVSWHGMVGDRRWAFIRAGVEKSGFPWFTLRQRANMNHYQPFFSDPDAPDTSSTMVKTPSGASYDVTDPALAEELFPGGVRVIRQNRGIFDTFPLSLITTQTIKQLGAWSGMPMDPLRFRPNILVESSDNRPFVEDEWIGRVLKIGGMRMRIDKRDGRCAVISIDPATAVRNPVVLRTVVEKHQGTLGVYGSLVEPGMLTVDDTVEIVT